MPPPSPKTMCSFYSHKGDLEVRWQGFFYGEHFPDPMNNPKHLFEALWSMCHLFGELLAPSPGGRALRPHRYGAVRGRALSPLALWKSS